MHDGTYGRWFDCRGTLANRDDQYHAVAEMQDSGALAAGLIGPSGFDSNSGFVYIYQYASRAIARRRSAGTVRGVQNGAGTETVPR